MSRIRKPEGQLSLELDDAAGTPQVSPSPDIPPRPLAVGPVHDLEQLDRLLAGWREAQWIRPLDIAFARTVRDLLAEQGATPSPLVILLAVLASHQVGRGHVCMDLAALLEDAGTVLALPPDDEAFPVASGPVASVSIMASGEQPLASQPTDILGGVSVTDCIVALTASSAVSDGTRSAPLVLDGTRLYLRRYWLYEQGVATHVRARLQQATAVADVAAPAAQVLVEALGILFPVDGQSPVADRKDTDYQKLACALAARSRFGVITGGPGTGKTTTVVKLLAALQAVAGESGERGGRKFRIRLAAPTGKAAARLNESIDGAVHRLPFDALPGHVTADDIPVAVTTLHRLLGSRPHSRSFRYHRDNRLPLDILVIDEASMVDLELMAAVFEALPTHARIILLGDKDQLASVDAGAVLGDLCRRARQGHYRPAVAGWLETVSAEPVPAELVDPHGHDLDQAVAMLRRTYRFETGSGIQQLAEAVNAGHLDTGLVEACRRGDFPDVVWLEPPSSRHGPDTVAGDATRYLCRHVVTGSPAAFRQAPGRRVNGQPVPMPAGYGHYLTLMRQHTLDDDSPRAAWDNLAREVLAAFGNFQLLCALRKGPWGVVALNERIAQHLLEQGLLSRTEGWYAGRPVLITANDYNLGLMNGDIGITFGVPWGPIEPDGRRGQVLRVAFPGNAGNESIRWMSPSRLQQLETVFAMTVHKSQGSEFTHACLVLPDHPSPILTRELLYTGITRARNWFSLIVGNQAVLDDCVRQRVTRVSALSDRIREHE